MIELSVEETNNVQKEYLDSLKSKCKLQILFGQNPFETYIVLNDQVVGFVQELSIHIEANNQIHRKIEIAFPKIDNPAWATAQKFAAQAKILESLGIQVKYNEIKWEKPSSELVEEKVFAASSDADFEKSLAMI